MSDLRSGGCVRLAQADLADSVVEAYTPKGSLLQEIGLSRKSVDRVVAFRFSTDPPKTFASTRQVSQAGVSNNEFSLLVDYARVIGYVEGVAKLEVPLGTMFPMKLSCSVYADNGVVLRKVEGATSVKARDETPGWGAEVAAISSGDKAVNAAKMPARAMHIFMTGRGAVSDDLEHFTAWEIRLRNAGVSLRVERGKMSGQFLDVIVDCVGSTPFSQAP